MYSTYIVYAKKFVTFVHLLFYIESRSKYNKILLKISIFKLKTIEEEVEFSYTTSKRFCPVFSPVYHIKIFDKRPNLHIKFITKDFNKKFGVSFSTNNRKL